MKNLKRAIKQLEQDINQNRQIIYGQYQLTKSQGKQQLIDKLVSPPVLITAFILGSLIAKKVKTTLKTSSKTKTKHPSEKISLVQKLLALSSEISVGISLFNRFKPFIAHLTQKTDRHINQTYN